MASNKGNGKIKASKVAAAPGGDGATKARGPALVWNVERDKALTQAARSGATTQDALCEALSGHPAFAGLAEGVLSPFKVAFRLRALRAAGVAIPFERLGRVRYQIDAAALNAGV